MSRKKIIPLKTRPTGPLLDEDFRIRIEKELKDFNENHNVFGKKFQIQINTYLLLCKFISFYFRKIFPCDIVKCRKGIYSSNRSANGSQIKKCW